MSYLTAPYLTLMNAFKHHSYECLDRNKGQNIYPTDLIRDFCTLRIDGGRQTGKTEAVSYFASEWIQSGGSVVVLANTASYANKTRDKIVKRHLDQMCPKFTRHELNRDIITCSIRSFLSDSCNNFRGRSLNRILFIIDEPINCPEINKFYVKWLKDITICHTSKNTNLEEFIPLFFVLGMQLGGL
ncbi:hypothetical protein AVV36_gp129 [Pectobacterium bacteriophage PM2]|uniref:Uncharacterized protein n=1 Tax=Pectobacterium bacteriophage PM2 TaxID=1429794 RepID=A0A0A0Q0F5_9CAUD|nr:hypothetical protein AVV36_gp129 [Pectobacterium bacteriophage PM2]AHY25091.1 hypothetical protein PM2_129 [Pectobacterium bacteriophage PM2]